MYQAKIPVPTFSQLLAAPYRSTGLSAVPSRASSLLVSGEICFSHTPAAVSCTLPDHQAPSRVASAKPPRPSAAPYQRISTP
eukprot:4013463-Pyramimonas_sp.AAC.1